MCKNPLLAEERRRKREALLRATEAGLDKIVQATRREQRRLKGKDKIGLRVGRVIGKRKMAKHFRLEIGEEGFSYRRDEQGIAQEAALDGITVIRTSVTPETLDGEHTVAAYKALSKVEQAFRSLKTVDLHVRPIHHRRARRVRAHVLLCMLAYYVEWHMRRALAPILFDDDDPATAEQQRTSAVAKARPSPSARRKAASKRTEDDLPVHSFRSLLADLATLTRNRIATGADKSITFTAYATPTPVQQRAFDLLSVRHIM
ncbi:MAG: transposase [SAR324 cluster bacterium]|nr:transposase [SAR324 cluster bacterium]